jgi:hypothetical protein
MTTLFINHEIVDAEIAARRERLLHDWQQHPRRVRRSRRVRFSFHLPVHAGRHA